MAIRKVKNKTTTLEDKLNELADAEMNDYTEMKNLKKTRENLLKNELDSAFYFSVIFETGEERDKWLKEYGIVLKNDIFSVLAKDFVNKVRPK